MFLKIDNIPLSPKPKGYTVLYKADGILLRKTAQLFDLF